MQISEELIRKIIEITTEEVKHYKGSDFSEAVSTISPAEAPTMSGKDRINEVKSDYSTYPKAQKGTDPKEIVVGVGAAFQREIKKTICGIPLDDVLKNIKAGIEEEGMKSLFFELEMPLVFLLYEMQMIGIQINCEQIYVSYVKYSP